MTKIKETLFLSVVIPAFNEEERIQETLMSLIQHLETLGHSFNLVVVDDGSNDRTVQIVAQIKDPRLKLLSLPCNQGKGAALRRGIIECKEGIIFLVDADLPYALDSFETALDLLDRENCQGAIGARDLPQSGLPPSHPVLRVWMGKTFSYLVNWLLPIRIFDTQCGFKAFRSSTLKQALLYTLNCDYTLDIELLLLFHLWGLEIRKLPVTLVQYHGSKIRIFRDSLKMLTSLICIFFRLKRSQYPLESATETVETVSCPVCDHDNYTVKALIEGRSRFCRCRQCQSLYQNPRLRTSLITSQYKSSYFSSNSVLQGYLNYSGNLMDQKKTASWLWDRIQEFSSTLSPLHIRVLEIGCGSGQFLNEGIHRGATGWGLDIHHHPGEKKFHFIQKDFLSAELPTSFFDLVVFDDSFEHFPQPRPVLERCSNVLIPGGLLLINTPDPDGWLSVCSGRSWISLKHEHLVIYPRQMMKYVFESHGFEQIKRLASRQYVEWTYVEPRLQHLSWLLARTLKLLPRSLRNRSYQVPTGGMVLMARLSNSASRS